MKKELINIDTEVICNLQITKTLIGQADDLAIEHENFYDHYIIGGRVALYELLGKIYGLVQQLDLSADKEDQIALLRTNLANKYGIRTQENTSDTTVLVRYITKADRKTAHVYSRAIEAARQNGIASNNFVSYVEQAGGVERIRSNAAAAPENEPENEIFKDEIGDMLNLTRDYLCARSELPLGSFKLPKKICGNHRHDGLTHYICHERNGREYVLARLNISEEQEAVMLRNFAKELFADRKAAERDVNKFYAKAMAKRKKRTMKEISKKRPEVADRMLRKITH